MACCAAVLITAATCGQNGKMFTIRVKFEF
jgi:hypothetical protein